MNPEFCESKETWCTRILKNESGILLIFWKFGYENFKKWIQNFTNFWKFSVWEFKKWIRNLRIFENLAYGNLEKWIQNFTNFWKFSVREFRKMNSNPELKNFWKFGVWEFFFFKMLSLEFWGILEMLEMIF